MQLSRTQVLLEPEQHQALSEIARLEKVSVSQLIRDMIRAQLYERKRKQEQQVRQHLSALEGIREHRQAILARRNQEPLAPDPNILLDEIREENDERFFVNLA
jgi:DNA-binding MarR family transcriptional regulator